MEDGFGFLNLGPEVKTKKIKKNNKSIGVVSQENSNVITELFGNTNYAPPDPPEREMIMRP